MPAVHRALPWLTTARVGRGRRLHRRLLHRRAVKPMPLLALGLYITGLALAFGVRAFVHGRRTGGSGLRNDAGAVGSVG